MFSLTEFSIWRAMLLAALLSIFLVLSRIFYNLYLNPLRKFPGPVHWAASAIPSAVSLCRGDLVHDVRKLHLKYGDIVRVGPNSLSFTNPDALRDIMVHRPGHETFQKDGTWWDVIPGQAESVVSLPTGRDHARIRRALSAGFTEKTLIAQESMLRKYVDLLVAKLKDIVVAEGKQDKGSIVNIADWYNYTTFDIIGDLMFAESFDCLRDSQYHPWITVIFENLRAIAYLISIRLMYRPLETMLFTCLPAKATQAMDDHYSMSCKKIHRRLGLETSRPDIMASVLQNGGIRDEKATMTGSKDRNPGEGSMTINEIEGSFTTLIIAGSETTATSLIGSTNNLVNNPDKLKKLVDEIRGTFPTEKDITLSQLKDLPYLNAVISETMRLCPPVPVGLAHLVPKGGDTVCGHWLPGGTHVSVATYALHRDPARFYESEKFLPERWLASSIEDSSSVFKDDVRNAVQAFGLGKRQCLGMQLAYAELRLILARMAWSFDMERAETRDGLYPWSELRTYQLLEKRPFDIILREPASC
ncbi:hypothetical protein TWF694_009384 [Orbilia ellipsospora]|uniref:Cytochrome P450 n=1 Tax=Orbilia ellipsospora TaxID=2528407 RepID=A0AAV9XAL5_9PEZI